MISFLISLLVICILLGVAWYIIGLLPLPSPIRQIVNVIYVVIAALLLIYFLLNLAHAPFLAFR